ncbi:MAG: DsbA family protein [Sphingobacteriales bacterium]|nr:MAG: DsbA family protein [Sphingobacteriales bacterium]
MTDQLLYIMDPLCGWCYGFSPVMMKLKDAYPQYPVQVISGGMMTGTRVQPMSEMAQYVLQAYHRVEEYSGVKFGEPYLDMLRDGTDINDSEPPCRAIHTFNQMQPTQSLEFAHELQLAHLLHGKSFNSEQTYRDLATQFGLDADAFMERMNSEEARYGTQQDFQWVQAAGITGFPCLVLQRDDKYYMVSKGFQPYEGVAETMQHILNDPNL